MSLFSSALPSTDLIVHQPKDGSLFLTQHLVEQNSTLHRKIDEIKSSDEYSLVEKLRSGIDVLPAMIQFLNLAIKKSSDEDSKIALKSAQSILVQKFYGECFDNKSRKRPRVSFEKKSSKKKKKFTTEQMYCELNFKQTGEMLPIPDNWGIETKVRIVGTVQVEYDNVKNIEEPSGIIVLYYRPNTMSTPINLANSLIEGLYGYVPFVDGRLKFPIFENVKKCKIFILGHDSKLKQYPLVEDLCLDRDEFKVNFTNFIKVARVDDSEVEEIKLADSTVISRIMDSFRLNGKKIPKKEMKNKYNEFVANFFSLSNKI